MPTRTPLLVSSLPPSRAQKRSAFAVLAALFALFVAVLPYAQQPLPRASWLVPVVSSLMFLGDCITAVLLFGQFAVLRSRALLVLAGGYLFTGLLVVPYALTFPGAFSDTGLLGADFQTAAWIFVVWHLGLPIAIMAYALLGDAPRHQRPMPPVPRAIAYTVATAVVAASLVTWFAIAYGKLLPVTLDEVRMSRQVDVLGGVVVLSIGGLVLLARKRRSVLDLWLLVVSFAWLLDSGLTFLTESRYTVAWYANRVIRIVSANLVLFVLVAESTVLYARLASSILAQRQARESRLVTLEAMSAAIEHEVRQPLAAVIAHSDVARYSIEASPPNVAEARDALATIAQDAERAVGILRSVRQLFARQAARTEAIDANALIEETVGLVRVELEAAAIGVQLQLADSLPRVMVDRDQLREVILNLLHNAAEAMRDVTGHAAVLGIASRFVEGRVEISVADTGTGVDSRNLERVFEPFFTTKPGGTGLGLSICKWIVERHGGAMSAAPGAPYGSVFRVVLPADGARAAKASATPRSPA